jgi:acyl carrier protein
MATKMNEANETRLKALFMRVMGVKEWRTDYAMRQLVQWDSLKHVELLTEIDEQFNVQIDPTELWKMASVKGIVEVLSRYVE